MTAPVEDGRTAVQPSIRGPAASDPAAKRRRAPRRRISHRNQGWIYAAPTALFVTVFFIVPVLLVLQMSLSDWSLFAGNRGFNAPENYVDAVGTRLFWPAVGFTVKYTVITTVILIAVAVIVWRFAGFYMLLLLVGLQGIPADVYEAARVDGAGRWQTFRHVTLPLLKSSLALCTILCITGSLLAFEQFYILTRGGPDNTTVTIVQLIYNVAFQGRNDLGVAAALSLVVLLGLIIINSAQHTAL